MANIDTVALTGFVLLFLFITGLGFIAFAAA